MSENEDDVKDDDTQKLKLLTKDESDDDEGDDEDEDDGVVVYSIGIRHSGPVIALDPRPPVDLLPAFAAARLIALGGGDPFFVFEGDPDGEVSGVGAAVVSIPDVVAITVVLSDYELQDYLDPEEEGEETPIERVQREAEERRQRKAAQKAAQKAASEAGKAKKGKGLKGLV